MKVLLIKRKACIYTIIYKHNIKTYFNSIHQHINRKAKFFQKKNRNTCLSETSISLYILIDIYKPSPLLTLIISAGVIFQIFGAKYLNVVKPYLVVYTAPSEKFVWDRSLHSMIRKSNNSDIIWFDKPFFTLNNSFAKKGMFLWWIDTELSNSSNSWNEEDS